MCIKPEKAIVFFCFVFLRLEEEGSVSDPSGLAGVKNETQGVLHPSELAFSACARLMSWKRNEGGGWKWVLFLTWSGWVVGFFAHASSLSDHQVDSQMAPPSADPCLALANAQLASSQPAGAAKKRDLWTKWTHGFCYLCHNHLLFSVPYFTWICYNILDPDAITATKAVKHNYLALGVKKCSLIKVNLLLWILDKNKDQ